MEKILISLYVPSIHQSYDVFVPNQIKIQSLVELLASTVENISMNEYMSSHEEILCNKKGVVMDEKKYLLDYYIQNGDKIMLI